MKEDPLSLLGYLSKSKSTIIAAQQRMDGGCMPWICDDGPYLALFPYENTDKRKGTIMAAALKILSFFCGRGRRGRLSVSLTLKCDSTCLVLSPCPDDIQPSIYIDWSTAINNRMSSLTIRESHLIMNILRCCSVKLLSWTSRLRTHYTWAERKTHFSKKRSQFVTVTVN